jgi:hypothetical protein
VDHVVIMGAFQPSVYWARYTSTPRSRSAPVGMSAIRRVASVRSRHRLWWARPATTSGVRSAPSPTADPSPTDPPGTRPRRPRHRRLNSTQVVSTPTTMAAIIAMGSWCGRAHLNARKGVHRRLIHLSTSRRPAGRGASVSSPGNSGSEPRRAPESRYRPASSRRRWTAPSA